MDKDKVEEASVIALRQYLLRCPRIKPIINDKEKSPFWDGNLYVYKKDDQKGNVKDNFHGRVPVQVKGRSDDNSTIITISRSEANIYMNDGGFLYFKVLVKEDFSSTILYTLLSKTEIKACLHQSEGDIKFYLEEVPKNPFAFQQIIVNFVTFRNGEIVERFSPKEIADLVRRFEKIRGHLGEIEDKDVKIDLEFYLDLIKNLKDDSTIGWRDKFIYYSRKALDLVTNHFQSQDLVYLQGNFGSYLHNQKLYHLEEDYHLEALSEFRKRNDILNVAIALNNLGNLHSDLTHYEEAEKEYQESLEIRRELVSVDRDAYVNYLASVLNNLGLLHTTLNRKEKAEQEYLEALEIYHELAEADRDAYIADVANTLNNLAILHKDLTRYEEAEQEYLEALEIRRELVTTDRDAYIADVANTLNNLACLHEDLNRKEEAEQEYQESLEIRYELAATNRAAYISDVADTLNNLANLHVDFTRYEVAEQEIQDVLKIFRELAENNRDAYIGYVAKALYNFARMLLNDVKRLEEARDSANEALCIYQELANNYPQVWNRYVELTQDLLELIQNLSDLFTSCNE